MKSYKDILLNGCFTFERIKKDFLLSSSWLLRKLENFPSRSSTSGRTEIFRVITLTVWEQQLLIVSVLIHHPLSYFKTFSSSCSSRLSVAYAHTEKHIHTKSDLMNSMKHDARLRQVSLKEEKKMSFVLALWRSKSSWPAHACRWFLLQLESHKKHTSIHRCCRFLFFFFFLFNLHWSVFRTPQELLTVY